MKMKYKLSVLIISWAILAHPFNCFADSKILVPVTSFDKNAPVLNPAALPSNKLKIHPSIFSTETTTLPTGSSTSTALVRSTCPTNKSGLTDGFQVFTYSLTSDMAAALSFWGKSDLSATDKVVLYQFTWYKDILSADGSVEGRCGAGVMLALRVSNLQANLALTLPTLAATSQLGQSTITYKLGTFGLSGASIDAAIPNASTIGKFDTESYAALMQSISQVQTAYKSNSSDFVVTPRPIAVSFSVPTPGSDTTIAIQAFAMRQIAQGKSCRDAKSPVPSRDSNTDGIVENVYLSVAGKGCSVFSGSPDGDIQKKVTDLMALYGISSK